MSENLKALSEVNYSNKLELPEHDASIAKKLSSVLKQHIEYNFNSHH